jgi:penicillin-binding protein-related factor A (putative recombinase)
VSEKAIEKQILLYLWARRIFSTKIDSTGIYDPKKQCFRSNKNEFKRKGVSDIIGIYKGKFLSIEVKSEKGKLTEDQMKWFSDVKSNGGVAFVARSIEDVERELLVIDRLAQVGQPIGQEPN